MNFYVFCGEQLCSGPFLCISAYFAGKNAYAGASNKARHWFNLSRGFMNLQSQLYNRTLDSTPIIHQDIVRTKHVSDIVVNSAVKWYNFWTTLNQPYKFKFWGAKSMFFYVPRREPKIFLTTLHVLSKSLKIICPESK